MTKSASPPNKVCLYCGLQSAATNHGSVGECVHALKREVARLSDHLRQGTPNLPVVTQHASNRDVAGAPLARLGRVG